VPMDRRHTFGIPAHSAYDIMPKQTRNPTKDNLESLLRPMRHAAQVPTMGLHSTLQNTCAPVLARSAAAPAKKV
jgi:hypothetical protein